MEFEDLLDLVKDNKKVLIIGAPGSGKTELANRIAEKLNKRVIHTDDYKSNYEYTQQLYVLIANLLDLDWWIVEGVQGYRLLRKIAQVNLDGIRPDLVIHIDIDKPVDSKHRRMAKGLIKIWHEYLVIERKFPKIIYYDPA